jgi:hypothetical protein
MTESEYQKVRREAQERIKRTTFRAPDNPRDDWEARTHHAEFEQARH